MAAKMNQTVFDGIITACAHRFIPEICIYTTVVWNSPVLYPLLTLAALFVASEVLDAYHALENHKKGL